VLVPTDNPFAGPNDNARLTAAFGLRNPFRIHVDPSTGRVFIADVGFARFEEIDLLEPDALGQNYGWPFREGPAVTTTAGCLEPGGSGAGTYTAPIAFYDRSTFAPASVIGAGVYRPVNYPFDLSFPPEYDGDYFFAEYYRGFLRRLKEGAEGTWSIAPQTTRQPNATDWATGLSTAADFSVGPDGGLYYVSQFGNGGSVHRISFMPDTIIAAGNIAGPPGATGVWVDVTTSAAVDVGSTDLRLTFDPAALEAVEVTSTLEGFGSLIDNVHGTVATASASGDGQSLVAGGTLFRVMFDILPTAPSGCSVLGIEDADEIPPDDLTGPAPPIPPNAILWGAAAASACVTVCGNSILEAAEECDDGNQRNGDCCSAACRFESNGSGCTDDGNPCTDDVCNGGGTCTHPNNAASCDDGLFCNGPDTCSGGTCTHLGNPCAGAPQCANLCNEAADNCLSPPGTPCTSDENGCTDDACNGTGSCDHLNNTAPCDDGIACTEGDICRLGVCAGTPNPARCSTGNECLVASCARDVGCVSVAAEDGIPCVDDGDRCTADVCAAGRCAHLPRVSCTDLGDVDCDGAGATPIDAQVILCLENGRCVNADVPAPCDDPEVRRARSDWDLNGIIGSADAMTTLRLFVGRLGVLDTELGSCCASR
jgi:cysteine-rich repeat protein